MLMLGRLTVLHEMLDPGEMVVVVNTVLVEEMVVVVLLDPPPALEDSEVRGSGIRGRVTVTVEAGTVTKETVQSEDLSIRLSVAFHEKIRRGRDPYVEVFQDPTAAD